MSQRVLLGLVVVVITISAVVLFMNNTKQPPATEKQSIQSEETSLTADDASQQSSGGDSATNSRYTEYSKTAFDQAAGKKRVLFFYASWCPTCRPADAELQAKTDQIPQDVTVFRVNYNDPDTDEEEKALAKKYGVTYQHTYVLIDQDGKEIKKWNGGSISELLANIT